MARSKALPLLFFLGLLSFSFSPAIATIKFNFFYLTLMWPGTYCNGIPFNKCCRPTAGTPAPDFFVQALKPYNITTGETVTECAIECCFSLKLVKKLIDDLNHYWSDVSCPSNNGHRLWEDVWCTYGTCSNLTESVYFQRALALRAQVNLLSIFKRNGIVPSSTKYYSLKGIQKALKGIPGSSTVVECNRQWLFFGDYYLYKIHICISSDAKSIISCPIKKSTINCGSEVKFLPFDPRELPVSTGAHNMPAANPIKMPAAAIDMDM
ncbi:ribonuclease 3 [Elaeis guineensis]|uniref:Ribonuclease 1 n=1 Tax=Elaeis guineensis var. tenera TaxID=51953 RepID=A0A6I9QR90_ELAGV|nr:ribonuclease 1 [Elaeis guineensis]